MPPIVDLLRSEIARLEAALAAAIQQRSGLVERMDAQIGDLKQRLEAAQLMLRTYIGAPVEIGPDADGQPSLPMDEKHKSIDMLTDDQIALVSLPITLRGHPIRAGSKRTKIIRGAKAFLEIKDGATRSEILEFLEYHGIMGNEKSPGAYLSVILSYANDIFVTDGVHWSLRKA